MHFIRRFLALIGIGALTPWGYSWGLFQTIGGAGLITLLVIWLPSQVRLIIGAVLSLSMVYPGWHPEIIGILDLIIGSGFMVTGGLLAVLAITWSYGRSRAMQQIFTDPEPGPVYRLMFLWMRYVIPLALTGILVATIIGAVAGE